MYKLNNKYLYNRIRKYKIKLYVESRKNLKLYLKRKRISTSYYKYSIPIFGVFPIVIIQFNFRGISRCNNTVREGIR